MEESQQPEETKRCRNCERDIGISKHRMHEVQCARMNYKCKECGEVVSKEDKEQHETEAHIPVKCQFCAFTAQKSQFGRHEEVCEMRPKLCDFCQETFKVERFFEHREQCGAQTKKCETCERFIMNKHRENHLTQGECQRFQQEKEVKNQREQQERLDELARFQADEAERREKETKRKLEEEKQARIKQTSAAQVIKQAPATNPSRPNAQPVARNPPIKTNPINQAVPAQLKPSSKPVIQNQRQQPPKQISKPVVQQNSRAQAPVEPETNEMDAALIQQLMEEDMNQQLAESLQNENFGGAAAGGQGNNNAAGGMMGAGNQDYDMPPEIRRADSSKVQQLVGGGDSDEEFNYHTGSEVNVAQARQLMQQHQAQMGGGNNMPQQNNFQQEEPLPQQPGLMRQSESQVQLEKAIAASMEPEVRPTNVMQENASMDEDEALARAIAESMQ